MTYHPTYFASLNRYRNKNSEKTREQRRRYYLRTRERRLELEKARREFQEMQIQDVISQNGNDPDSLFFGLSLDRGGGSLSRGGG